ncbi:hypothetical protein LP415_08285 [Polaromonas sp. P1(28)-8]|nr:hypothetical protein LP415_08285 [Polaromonas sp. P1(28)-8]
MILDKKNTRVFVFDPSGKLRGATPVLVGAAKGDDSVTGIGGRPIAEVAPHERTTPAGRFMAEPGRNTLGEDVVWVDYEAAVSMHRVRALEPAERRLERLASPTTDDNRISYGCINMPVEFLRMCSGRPSTPATAWSTCCRRSRPLAKCSRRPMTWPPGMA